jgi:hypothetical protein
MESTSLAYNRDIWRAAVNTAMYFQVIWNARNFLTSWGPVSFCNKDCSMEVVKMWLSILQVSEIYCEVLREWMQYSETNFPRSLFLASGISSLHVSPVSAYHTLHVRRVCQPSHPIKYIYLLMLQCRLRQPDRENTGTLSKRLHK